MATIRPANYDDVRAITRILQCASPGFEFSGYSRSDWADLTKTRDLVVAECFRDVVGFGIVRLRGYGRYTCRVAYIEGVYALPREKDPTVRPLLLEACQEAARRAGHRSVLVLTELDQVGFFRQAGFEILGAEYDLFKRCYLAKRIGTC